MTFDREQTIAQVIQAVPLTLSPTGSELAKTVIAQALPVIVRAVTDEIRALHQRDPSGAFCDHCWGGPTVRHIPSRGSAASEPRYPCPTVRLLDSIEAIAGGGEGNEPH